MAAFLPFSQESKSPPRRDCRHQTAATQLRRSGTPRQINQIKNDICIVIDSQIWYQYHLPDVRKMLFRISSDPLSINYGEVMRPPEQQGNALDCSLNRFAPLS